MEDPLVDIDRSIVKDKGNIYFRKTIYKWQFSINAIDSYSLNKEVCLQ